MSCQLFLIKRSDKTVVNLQYENLRLYRATEWGARNQNHEAMISPRPQPFCAFSFKHYIMRWCVLLLSLMVLGLVMVLRQLWFGYQIHSDKCGKMVPLSWSTPPCPHPPLSRKGSQRKVLPTANTSTLSLYTSSLTKTPRQSQRISCSST